MRFGLYARLMLFAAGLIMLTGTFVEFVFLADPMAGPFGRIARGVGIAAVPGLALAMVFAHRISRALEAVNRAARGVEGGDLTTRIDSKRQDEIGDLARHFDRMLDEVQRDRHALESARHKEAVTAKALVTSARLASMGQLAAGVAHEVNNPLTYVRANLGQLRNHWALVQKQCETAPADDEIHLVLAEGEEMIAESLEGVERAVSIVRDIKGFAHTGSDEFTAVEVRAMLESVLRVASPQLGSGIRVEMDETTSICVRGSGQQLKQVFLNLIVNAAQSIDGAGTISIETRELDREAEIVIRDDGPGIESDVLEYLFDPFFTTKPVGKGMGLGLSISHEIVERHGGSIRVESAPGEGAAFFVRIPLDS